MTYQSVVLAQSPTLLWGLDDVSGTAATDASGNSHPGVYHGSPTLGGAALHAGGGGSVQLNTIAKYVDIAAASSINNTSFSFSFWVRMATNSSYHTLVNRDGTSSSRGWSLYLNAGKLDGFDGTADHTSTGVTIGTGSDHHVGVSCDGTTVKFYVDGALDFSFSAVFGWLSNGAAGGSSSSYLNALTLGANLSGTSGYNFPLDGQSEDFAYWAGTALTATDFSDQYNFASGAAAVTAASTLTIAASVSRVAAAALSATSALTSAAFLVQAGATSMSATSTFSATGVLGNVLSGDAALSATSTLTDAASLDRVAVTGLSATSTFTAAGTVTTGGGGGVSTPGTVQVATFFSTSGFTTSGGPGGGGGVPGVMDLIILDPIQGQAPTSLNIVLTGADPLEEIVFTVSGVEVWRDTADDNGSLFAISIPIPGFLTTTGGILLLPVLLTAGDYVLTATGAHTATATFHLNRDSSRYPQVVPDDIDPVEVPGRGSSWMLQDPRPGGLGSWIMHPSPSSMSEPELAKTLTVDHTTSPSDGQWHISIADIGNKEWTWSGYCPDQAFYNNLKAYADLNRRIWTFDHRGRAWKTSILRFDAKARKRQIETDGSANDWAHDYTITAVVYENRSWVPS